MKKLISFFLPLMLVSVCGHPAFGQDRRVQWENIVGSAIGSALANQRPPFPPGGRPPYPPYDRYGGPPIRTVYVQQPAAPAAPPQQVQVAVTAVSASTSSTPLSFVPNITVATTPAAPKEVVKKMMDALKKNAYKQWDKIADGFDDALMTDEKAAFLAKKLLDTGQEKKKVSELLIAIENGETDIAGRLVSDLTGDPLEGMQVTKAMKFGELVSEITDQLEEGTFTNSDISAWKKAFAKMKLAAKQQKAVDRCLAELKGILDFIEILSDYKPSVKPIPVPTDPVALVFCPTLPNGAVFALDSMRFLVGTDDDVFSVDEGYLVDKVAIPPTYATTPVSQTTTTVNAVTLVNSANQNATYYLDDNTGRTLAPGTQATFAVPGSGSISVNSRGRRSPFTVGTGRYSLSYTGNNTWSVTTALVSVTLDNFGNPFPLNCFVNREPYIISPGGHLGLELEGGVIDVQFARGEDVSQTARYQFDANGTYKIGLDKRDGKWALFPADAVLAPMDK